MYVSASAVIRRFMTFLLSEEKLKITEIVFGIELRLYCTLFISRIYDFVWSLRFNISISYCEIHKIAHDKNLCLQFVTSSNTFVFRLQIRGDKAVSASE